MTKPQKKAEAQGVKKPSEMYVLKRYDSVLKQLETLQLATKEEQEQLLQIKSNMVERYIKKTF